MLSIFYIEIEIAIYMKYEVLKYLNIIGILKTGHIHYVFSTYGNSQEQRNTLREK